MAVWCALVARPPMSGCNLRLCHLSPWESSLISSRKSRRDVRAQCSAPCPCCAVRPASSTSHLDATEGRTLNRAATSRPCHARARADAADAAVFLALLPRPPAPPGPPGVRGDGTFFSFLPGTFSAVYAGGACADG
jgi:hypothetical protein